MFFSNQGNIKKNLGSLDFEHKNIYIARGRIACTFENIFP